MRLVLEQDDDIFLVRSVAPGEVVIGARRFTAPLMVSPRKLLPDWNAGRLAELTDATLAPLLALTPRIVLLGVETPGVGTAPRELRSALERRGIALDVMSTAAACRTYNVLASERREVVAGLLLSA